MSKKSAHSAAVFAERSWQPTSKRQSRRDSLQVVVKRRFKPDCFVSEEEEAAWRHTTEFMLNMPRCEGIAQVFEVFENDEAYFVVNELVEGMDLYEMLDDSGNVEVDVAREIVYQLLEAVHEFHEQGAVHKDLKLENVVVNPKVFESMPAPPSARARRKSAPPVVSMSNDLPRSLKVIDFDTVIARANMPPRAAEVLGTNQYIPPEAYAGEYSPSSDMFSVGVIAYRLLTGDFPFSDTIFDDMPLDNWVGSVKMRQIQRRIRSAEIDWDYEVFETHPDALEITQKMLSVKSNLRPTAAEALAHRWFVGDSRTRTPSLRSGSSRASSMRTSGGSAERSLGCDIRRVHQCLLQHVPLWHFRAGSDEQRAP
eukprot:TRINITY_DN34035_c0_g2_i4.p1 TRINITY_DN34035_c0_g2~~TRINITY_DN34035_c0_g2_i4.p1  ORF type:complete len:368 (-),score=59.33 TRINITY_DN34035_c0_g2_i4:32-1135(-)